MEDAESNFASWIKTQYPQGVAYISNKDPGLTGNFEITVDGVLVHSKTTMSHDTFESKESEARMKNYLDQRLYKMDIEVPLKGQKRKVQDPEMDGKRQKIDS